MWQGFVGGPPFRADDVELEGPDIADIGLRVVTGGGSASQQAPLVRQDTKALRPSISSGVVDNDVNSTWSAPGARLAVELDDFLDIILCRRVENVIGADLFELRRLII